MLNNIINILDRQSNKQYIDIETNEDGNKYIVLAVPGFNKNNITVKLKRRCIEIKGESRSETFGKKIDLNQNIDGLEAKVKDGLLYLTFKFKDNEYKEIIVN